MPILHLFLPLNCRNSIYAQAKITFALERTVVYIVRNYLTLINYALRNMRIAPFAFYTEMKEKNVNNSSSEKNGVRNNKEAARQHELFKATLDAQEKERKRIAESLHNGLGQILYGIKLTLSDLHIKPNDVWQEKHEQTLQDTERLLTEAINETRRMSHELIPSVLEDFGLKTAIEDICRQFKHVLNITCSFEGLPAKMDQYIELALYRMIQELVTNIIKHAAATQASIHIDASENINVIIKDNGKGFSDKPGSYDGIGLKTIQSNIKMLGGTLHINSAPGAGTTINITIPYKPAGI